LRVAPTITAVLLVTLAACSLDPFAGREAPRGGQVHTGLIGGPAGDATGDGVFDGAGEPELRILALDPPRGSPAGGETITIEGGGFSQGCHVTFEGVPVQELYYVNTKTLMVVTPANPSGLADVVVENPDGDTAVAADGFLYTTPLAVVSLSPDRGPIEGGTPVTITGGGFLDDTVVLIGHRMLMQAEILGDDTIVGITPPGDAGGAVTVFAGNIGGGAILDGGFVYTVAPELERAVPAMGPVAGDAVVRLEGRWLASVNHVWFGTRAAEILSKDNWHVEVRTPAGDGEGPVDVRIEGNWGAAVLPAGYSFVDAAAHDDLVLLGVHPDRGDTAGGDIVELAVCGQAAGAAPSATFGGVPAVAVDAEPGICRLVVQSPPGDPGDVDVRVTQAGASSTLPGAFEYVRAFLLGDIAPAAGPMSGGTRVTLTGEGFEGVLAVRFGAFWGSNIELIHGGSLAVTTPPGAPGLVDVSLVREDGETVKKPGGFEYLSDGPLVALVEPVYGAQAGGTMVTIIGAGFHPGSAVRFGEVYADDVIFQTPTELWAWTPPGDVGTVDVTVETIQGDALLAQAYSYFDPGAYWGGGTWGDPIDGAVNVTVLDSYLMDPLPDAYVILGDSAASPWQGWTDERGQITFSGPSFFGPVAVHATKAHHDVASVVDFDAENVTVYLVPEEPPPTTGPTDPPPDPPPPGRVRGKVLGLSKYVVVPPGSCLHEDWVPGGPCAPCVDDGDCSDGDCRELGDQGSFCTTACLDNDDCPGDFLCAGGAASTWSWCVPPAGPRAVNCEVSGTSIYVGWGVDDGPSWLDPADPRYDFEGTRLGEVAVVCFGGYTEAGTGDFVPLAMGVKRHVMVGPGETIEDQNIYLGIPLNRELRLRMDRPPIFEPGDGYYRVRAYLDFGSDGVADLRQGIDSYVPEDIRFEHLPEELAGDIYDAEYVFIAGAYSNTTDDTPYSVILYNGVSELDVAASWSLDGALWTESGTAPVDPLLAVCDAGDALIAVGQDGMAARLGEGGWGAQPKLVGLDLLGCATGPSGEVVAVGEGGAVLLRVDGLWSFAGTVTDRDLRAVAWTSAGVIIAAGPQRVVRFDADGWHETKVTFDLHGAASAGAVAWVVGTAGTILRSDGGNWILESAPTDQDLFAAAGLGDGHVIAAGDGVVLLRTAAGWVSLDAPDDLRYVAADGPAPNDFWLVAEGGALVHRINDAWEIVRPSDALEFMDVVAGAGDAVAVGAPALLFTPFQHFPVFSRPTEGGPWKSLRLTWNNGEGPVPKFHTLSLAEESGRTFWRLIVNGPARDIRLPDFDAASGWDPVKSGPKRLRAYSIHKDDFNIDGFDWSDLSTYRWRAWAYDMILFD
jgi:hypothetical protein